MQEILRITEVAVMCGVSDTTIRTWVRTRGFPPGIHVRWDKGEVVDWCIKNRVAMHSLAAPVK